MKIKIVTDYDTIKQEEVLVEAQLNHFQIDEIVQNFFHNMDYYERRARIKENMKKEQIKETA
jgi:acid stress-induced BolA-like protein IbaG/YrbA